MRWEALQSFCDKVHINRVRKTKTLAGTKCKILRVNESIIKYEKEDGHLKWTARKKFQVVRPQVLLECSLDPAKYKNCAQGFATPCEWAIIPTILMDNAIPSQSPLTLRGETCVSDDSRSDDEEVFLLQHLAKARSICKCCPLACRRNF